MENYHLYIITNLVNQKKYIGITKIGFERRFQIHLDKALVYNTEPKKILYNAMRKYNRKNFKIKFLAEGDDWNHLCKLECEAIIEYNTYVSKLNSWGYNMTKGGDGVAGHTWKWSDEQIERQRIRNQDPAVKRMRSKTNPRYWLGKNIPKDVIMRIGKTVSDLHKDPDGPYGNEYVEKQKESARKIRYLKTKTIMINNTIYESCQEAAKAENLNVNSITRRLKNPNFPDDKIIIDRQRKK